MAKRRFMKRTKPGPLPRTKRKLVIILTLSLCLLTTGVILAKRGSLGATLEPTPSPTAVPAPPVVQGQPPALAKEYIYAGGRLVATEEPQGSGSTYSIASIQPSSARIGDTIQINITASANSNLSNTTSVNFSPAGGITVFGVSATSSLVTATITVNATAALGTHNVTVSRPNQTSNPLSFAINPQASNPFPQITSISPPTVAAGSPGFRLRVDGANLIDLSKVKINGSERVTYFRGTYLEADILPQDVATSGTRAITVFNPLPGGGTSDPVTLTVTSGTSNPPTILAISPDQVTAGGAGFTLTVDGTNFRQDSVVQVVNLGDRTTSYVTQTRLQAQILSQDISSAGQIAIRVFNPGGGGFSNQAILTINPGGGGVNGLTAEYFNNLDLAGAPALTRNDSTIYFVWNAGSPSPAINTDQFSARWTGQVQPQFSGDYTFYVFSDDGVRLWVNGRKLIDKWYDQFGPEHTSSPITLTGGQRYDIRVEYYENCCGAAIQLQWSGPSTPKGQIPSSKLFTTTTGTGLKADYFNNKDLAGSPTMTRTDTTVDFTWDAGKPASVINPDLFSVRWTGQVQAQQSDFYTFYVLTDDGVRLWVNNVLLINKWFDQYGQEWNNTIFLNAGQRYDIRVEYYENGAGAEAHLSWSNSSMTKRIIPPTNLFPPGAGGPQPLYEGWHDGADCARIWGWAANRNQLNTSISVDIYDGGTLIAAAVPANLYRADVASYLGDNGLHGFDIPTPAVLRNGQPHSVTVKFSGTSINLTSSPRSLTCSGGPTLPAPPTGLTANPATASQINLNWSDNSANENGFRIARKDGSGGTYTDIATVEANRTTFSELGRTPGVTYFYKVLAFNDAGSSDYSNEAFATIAGGSGIPPTPGNLMATTLSYTQIRLNWTDTSTNETGFRVERRIDGTSFVRIKTLLANVNTWTDNNRAPSTTYYYRITAYNAAGESPYSNVAFATTEEFPSPCSLVSAFSGDGGAPNSYGYVEGAGSAARWRSPSAGAIGIDPVSGLNVMFVADTENHRIRMVYLEGPSEGHTTLVAGSGTAGHWDGDGNPYQARYNYPQGLAAIKGRNGLVEALLIADTDNNEIRMLLPPLGDSAWRPVPFSGKLNPGYLDGEPASSLYNGPQGIAIAADGFIYVADTGNLAVRRLDRAGNSSTLYTAPRFGVEIVPVGITASEVSEGVYISDQFGHSIYKVTSGAVELIAGSGSAGYANGSESEASFNSPHHLFWVPTQNQGELYISDLNNQRIRKVGLSGKDATNYAGSGAAGYINATCLGATFNLPSGISVSPSGEIYVIEKGNNSIRKIE